MVELEEIKILRDSIDKECENAIHTVCQAYNTQTSQFTEIPEYLNIAQCIVQMIILKAKTILNMTKGISLYNYRTHIVDFSSILPIIRSAYELCFIFHNIFISTETRDELEILLSIWKIRGLTCRQGIDKVPNDYLAKQKVEKEEIDALIKGIYEIVSRLKVSSKVKNDLSGILRYNGDNLKGYIFEKDNGEIVDIRGIRLIEGVEILPEFQNTTALYKWASMHIHASYLSVLQFGQAYSSKKVDNMTKTILESVYLICKTVSSDYNLLLQTYASP